MASRKSFFNSLKSFFNISSKKIDGVSDKVPFPAEDPVEKERKKGAPRPANLPDEALELYKFWLRDTYETAASLKDRTDRYNSLQYAYYNSPIVSATIDLYADEATQVDAQARIIEVEAQDKKLQRFINDFFDRIGLTQKLLRDVAWNIALYGDAFWVLTSSVERGITEIVPVDPLSVKDRMEFNAVEAQKRLSKNKGGFRTAMSKDTNLQAIKKIMDNDTDDYSTHFKNYLFGFQVEDYMMPPWNVLHFRAFTTQSEFYPFGRPVLINSLAPFRQLQASKNLMALGRANSFNIKHFKVKTDENATPEDKWEAVNEARQQFKNQGNEASGKEQFTVNSEVWTPEDLLDVDEIQNDFDAEKVADVEMLRDDLIMGTRIPKGYLIVDKASFGTSGQALLAQHKPFARAVYSIQSAMLEQLAQMVRVQMVMTGEFDPNEADFQLKMAFPQTEESDDRINNKSDLLRLAKDIADNIGETLGLDRGEALPPEVVKQIYGQFTFIDQEDIDAWVDATIEAQQSEGEEEAGGLFNKRTIRGHRLEEIRGRLQNNPQIVNDCYYDSCRRLNYMEGIMNNRHYYSSFHVGSQDRQSIVAFQNVKLQRAGGGNLED